MIDLPPERSAVVIGSGFGGAVTACRLAEGGFEVLLLERGRTYQPDDFPIRPDLGLSAHAQNDADAARAPDFRDAFWNLDGGLWDIRDLGDALVVQAAGLGGGSLIYANVHLRAPAEAFDPRDWPPEYTRESLDPYYDLVAHTIGVAVAPGMPKTARMEEAAENLGQRFARMPLAVSFDEPKGGPGGPRRDPCDLRGDCIFGCPRGAKNTLDFNYLARARDLGATLRKGAEVTRIERLEAGYRVHFRDLSTGGADSIDRPFVFLCAGAVGSTELLLKSRKSLGGDLGEVGQKFFPNADALAVVFGANAPHECDRGPTITSSIACEITPPREGAAARWRVPFRDGDAEPPVRSIVSWKDGEAFLARRPTLRSGSWAGGNAAGELTLERLSGALAAGQELHFFPPPTGGDRARGAIAADSSHLGTADGPAVQDRHFFLVQDGGLPEALEPVLGFFRSPLWIRRNRFLEQAIRKPGTLAPGDDSPASSRTSVASPFGFAELPAGPLRNLAGRLRTARLEAQGLATFDWQKYLPRQLATALANDLVDLRDAVAQRSEGFAVGFMDDVAKRLDFAKQIEGLLKGSGTAFAGLDAADIEDIGIGRRMLQLAVQVAFGSQAVLAKDAAKLLLEGLNSTPAIYEALVQLASWILDYRASDGRTALLLAMGRDSSPGRLFLETTDLPAPGDVVVGKDSGARARIVFAASPACGVPDATTTLLVAIESGAFRKDEEIVGDRPLGSLASAAPSADGLGLAVLRLLPAEEDEVPRRLRAELPKALDAPERDAQQRLLRDIAVEWQGELRTNPLADFFGREITVHPQGGCAMGRSPEEGVTDAAGEVRGCPGLYVMDAAAFPASVGVNPSATIAAVAEYKIERFLRVRLGDPGWCAGDKAIAAAKVDREMLDPFTQPPRPSPATRSEPVGIAFDERMDGTWRESDAGGEPSGPRGGTIETRLCAWTDDLSRFLALHRLGVPEPMHVAGAVTLQEGTVAHVYDIVEGDSRIVLYNPRLSSAPQRRLEYDLLLRPRGTAGGPSQVRLKGVKVMTDDPEFDLGEIWQDTTKLGFRWFEDGVCVRMGELRVPVGDFLSVQLPSFRATHTTDAARQSWALAAFLRFFFAELTDVYAPEVDELLALTKRWLGTTHV